MDNDGIGRVLLNRSRPWVEYHLRLIHAYRFYGGQFGRYGLACNFYLHRNVVPLLHVENFTLYPMRFLDGVESGYYLLPNFTAQTLAHLLEVFTVIFAPLVENHTLVIRYALYLFGVVKPAEIYPCPVGTAHYLPDAVLELEQARYAELFCCHLEILVNRLAYRGTYLAHHKRVSTVIERHNQYELRHAVRLARRRTPKQYYQPYGRVLEQFQQVESERIEFLVVDLHLDFTICN